MGRKINICIKKHKIIENNAGDSKNLNGQILPFTDRPIYETEELERKIATFMREVEEQEENRSKLKNYKNTSSFESVNHEEALEHCKLIIKILRMLIKKRNMTINEVRLTLAIEDNRTKEQWSTDINQKMDISKNEVISAFKEVVAGEIPKNRIALSVLARKMKTWPGISQSIYTNSKKLERKFF